MYSLKVSKEKAIMFFWNNLKSDGSENIEHDDKVYLVLQKWCMNIDSMVSPAVLFKTKEETSKYLIKKSLPSPFCLLYRSHLIQSHSQPLMIVPLCPISYYALETSFGKEMDVEPDNIHSREIVWSVKDLQRSELISAAGNDKELQKIVNDYLDLRDEEEIQKNLPEQDRYKFHLTFMREGEEGMNVDIVNHQFDILPYHLKQKVMETLSSILTDSKQYGITTKVEGTNLPVVLNYSQ